MNVSKHNSVVLVEIEGNEYFQAVSFLTASVESTKFAVLNVAVMIDRRTYDDIEGAFKKALEPKRLNRKYQSA